ncbi:Glucan 1,3-beta-glucosidase 3 [Tulasnella sp. 419]|nr:Glucan 1,3-beta-glucosidase 3 [Tulasnella sp. 419]
MQLQDLTALLISLGLIQSTFKPSPQFDISALQSPVLLQSSNDNNLSNATATNACSVEPYDSPDVQLQSFPPFNPVKANVYRYRQQQSVNMGSWFVQESWMVPSLFTCANPPQISEIDIASTPQARTILERHWDTFITEDDFVYLQKIGINTIRLPVGYWSLGPSYCFGTPFEKYSEVYMGSWPRILRAINWAAKYDIGVLIDMHGAYGSQNGQPHSGVNDGQTNLFNSDVDQEKTISALTFLAQQLASVNNIVGIQILNEPQNVATLPDFYTRAINTLREVSSASKTLPLYIHDGFDLNRFTDFVAGRQDFIVVDHHSYFVFTPQDSSEPAHSHTADVTHSISSDLSTSSIKARRNIVVDEWSCALTDKSLEGEKNKQESRKKFCHAQMKVYSNETAGWSFWSYKKEGCNEDQGWCFKSAIGKSLPSTFFSYPSQTGPHDLIASSAPSEDNNITSNSTDGHAQLPPLSEVIHQAAFKKNAATSQSENGEGSSHETYYPPNRAWKRSNTRRNHRHLSIHRRRKQSTQKHHPHPVKTVTPASLNTTSVADHEKRGYADGHETAIIFARYGMSRLGFKGQYIADTIKILGPNVVPPGKEESYAQAFDQGLRDAEKKIEASLDIVAGGGHL